MNGATGGRWRSPRRRAAAPRDLCHHVVGGADREHMKNRLPLFTAGVVGLSSLLLLVGFHSPLISLKAARPVSRRSAPGPPSTSTGRSVTHGMARAGGAS